MLPDTIVLVTDQPDRSAHISEALHGIATCSVVGPDADWALLGPVQATVCDLDLTRVAGIRCLERRLRQNWAARSPLLCVSHRVSDKALRQARFLGAGACLPFYAPPHLVVTALLNLVDPGGGTLNATIRQCADRANLALAALLASATSRNAVDLSAVDGCIGDIVGILRDGGIARWLNIARAQEDPVAQHCLTVAGLAAQFAAQIGFPEIQRRRLVRVALVHDIGMARIPRAIVLKRGALDPDETEAMRRHPLIGYEILLASVYDDPAGLDAVRHHHEMLDGSGYPDGLGDATLGDVVRFLTICDIFAALTARRPFRPAMSRVDAMAVLRGMAGKVEPRFVDAFERAVIAGSA